MKLAIWLPLTLALMSIANSSLAAGVALRWTNCYGDGGLQNRTFACDRNTGSNVIVGSFVLDSALPQVSGVYAVVDIGVATETLPAWWQFKNAGACRSTALSIFSYAGANCPDPFLGQASIGIATYQVGLQGPNTARIQTRSAVASSAVVDLAAHQEYGAFRLNISNAKTVGIGACGGCGTPACIALVSMTLYQTDGTSITLTDPAYGQEGRYVTWQSNGGPEPLQNPVCAAFDSAGFAVTTPVFGRGDVLRSRTKAKYPPGSPLLLIATPLAGDRFVAWSGDTTSTEDTLSVVVNRDLTYLATFERDPSAAASLISVDDVPADQGAHVLATWSRSSIDDATYPGLLCCYRVERTLNGSPAAPWVVARDSVPADFSLSYSAVATTPADSVLGDPAQLRYRVVTVAAAGSGEWMSNELLGHSVDNVAPPQPASVSGVMSTGVATLFWPNSVATDFSHYAIYRSLVGLPPTDDAHRVGTTTATNFTDSPGHFANYQVTVLDVHGNESPGTAFVPLNSVEVDDRAAPRAVTVGQPSPSPMRRNMSLSFGLPRRTEVTVDVLDSQGRHVRRLCEGALPAGWLTLSWDARDSKGSTSPPGIYFVRVQTPDGTHTRRIALIP